MVALAYAIPSCNNTFRCLSFTAKPWLLQKLSLSSFRNLSLASSLYPTPTATESCNDDDGTDAKSVPANETKSAPTYFPKRGQTIELECESLAFKGKGVCRVAETGFVVMCDRALPGERFVGRVTRRKGTYAEVKKLKTLSPHWDYVDAPCVYASYCGGCKTQNLSYEAQLKAKEQQVRDLVVHVGKFSDDNVMKPIVPCAIQFHYRNKMEFSVSTKSWVPEEMLGVDNDYGNGPALGLHAPGFFDKVLDINKCLLQSEPANLVLMAVQECWRDPDLGLSAYNVHSHAGFLKHLILRTGSDVQTGMLELMVNFVTSSYKPDLLKPLVDKISSIPEVVSIVNNINTSVGSTSVGEEEHVLYGKSIITEVLRGLTFQISANSFFQTNTSQAEVLYKLIEDAAGLKGDGTEIVLDLFCGTGTIGLTLAKRVKHVYGYEVVPQAILDARKNAELNGITNATFVQGDLNKIDGSFGQNFPRPDIVISDPNRPGMHMKLIKFLLNLSAQRIIYVSCNPATCARDLDYLCHGVEEYNLKGRYKLISVEPVDMFPHTPHIESHDDVPGLRRERKNLQCPSFVRGMYLTISSEQSFIFASISIAKHSFNSVTTWLIAGRSTEFFCTQAMAASMALQSDWLTRHQLQYFLRQLLIPPPPLEPPTAASSVILRALGIEGLISTDSKVEGAPISIAKHSFNSFTTWLIAGLSTEFIITQAMAKSMALRTEFWLWMLSFSLGSTMLQMSPIQGLTLDQDTLACPLLFLTQVAELYPPGFLFMTRNTTPRTTTKHRSAPIDATIEMMKLFFFFAQEELSQRSGTQKNDNSSKIDKRRHYKIWSEVRFENESATFTINPLDDKFLIEYTILLISECLRELFDLEILQGIENGRKSETRSLLESKREITNKWFGGIDVGKFICKESLLFLGVIAACIAAVGNQKMLVEPSIAEVVEYLRTSSRDPEIVLYRAAEVSKLQHRYRRHTVNGNTMIIQLKYDDSMATSVG
ncbi:hypothetical protein V2J09_011167 [Rumex salicifolius]